MRATLKQLLCRTIEIAPTVFWILDSTAKRHIYISKAYEQVWNRSRKSIYACPHSFLDSVHPDDYLRAVVMFDMQLRGEPTREEFRLVCPDGSIRWIKSECVRVRPNCRGNTFICGVSHDTTPMQTEGFVYHHDWVAPASFVAGVAHDFGNVLTAVIGNGELLLKTVGTNVEARSRVQNILHAGFIGTCLRNELVDATKVSPPNMHCVDLCSLVMNAVQILQSVGGEKVVLTTTVPRNPIWIHAHEHGVMRILLNLLINARDAMPEGGEVKITVHSSGLEEFTGQNEFAFSRSRQFAILEIADSGCGMDYETQKQVFQPFFTTKPDRVGGGLGLYTVKRIVDQFGGTIRFASTVGHGTSFQISLPKD